MEWSGNSMGSQKHGKSGWKNGAGVNPKERLRRKMEADKKERKRRKSKQYDSVQELMADR